MFLTTYTYDQFNHLTQVAMPRSTANGMKTQTRTFAYTSTGHPNINLPALWLTSATNPESGTVGYTYNSDGTLASKTDANGNTETYTYDVYQRLTSIPDRQQTFTYDTCPAAARGCVSMAGQLMQTVFGTAVGPNGLTLEYNYSYTPAGKVSGKTLQLTGGVGLQASTGTVTASYTFDGQGALTQTSCAPAYFVNTFNYTLDAMERPTGMTDNLSHTWVTGATYNAANQMTSNGIQTWTYNSLYQITGVTGTGMNMTYNYSATQNNGQIASSVDSVKSETIDYQYDLLKRLSSATATSGAWGESYVYDGYGNLTQMNPSGTAGAPSMNLTVQPDANGVPTNQITGTYDNNGNLKWLGNNTSLSYDAANRLNTVLANGQFSYYGYDADNRRVWYQNASGVQTIYFYGADGRKVTSYTFTMSAPNIVMTPAQNYGNIYFAGVPLETEGNAVSTDRLGSVRNGGPGGVGYQAEYPYGIEYSLTANDREKYATYTRDSITGLDYAVNRYYWSQWGRFISPDPYSGSASVADSQSWNRYAYAGNDPSDRGDSNGLDPYCGPNMWWQGEGCAYGTGEGGQGGPTFGEDGPGYSNCNPLYNDFCDNDPSDTCVTDPQGSQFGANSPTLSPPCSTSGGGGAPPPTPPQCPLVSPTGHYTVAGNAVALFAPDMAEDIDAAFAVLNSDGIIPTITSGFRTAAGQLAVQGSPYGAAQVSWHQVGEAIDINSKVPLVTFRTIVAAMTDQGLVWGGTFSHKDPVHFQNAPKGTSPDSNQVAACAQEHS